MKVERTIGPGTAHSIRKKQNDSSGGFSGLLDPESASSVAPVGVAAPMQNIAPLLQFQEVQEQPQKRKKQLQHGENLLNYLDELKVGLLGGTVSPHVVRGLVAQVCRQQEMFEDPELEAIIQEIETRAAVEIAKLGQGKNHFET